MRVLILDDDEDLRNAMAEVISDVGGHECIALGSYSELIGREDEVLSTNIALLDINLGPNQPSGLDAERWLADHRYQGSCVFLTAHANNHPLVTQAAEQRRAEVIEKPISLVRLTRLIERKRAA